MKTTVMGFARLGLAVAGSLLALLLGGCANIAYKQTIGNTEAAGPRDIAVFMDGTQNDEASDTNVKRLHSLLSLQNKPQLFTLYIEGVGTGSDLAGKVTGQGIGERVRIAYVYLLKHYRPGDRVYLFGFSRGAYSVRILNSLLYHAGLPARPSTLTHAEFAERIYDLVKVEKDYPAPYEPLRRQRVQEGLTRLYEEEWKAATVSSKDSQAPFFPRPWPDSSAVVPVQVLGLWDTVEALGFANWGSRLRHKARLEQHVVNIDDSNARYGDKLCNVQNAFHAMSIDDNREWIFTPLLLTRQHLFNGCAYGDNSPLFQDGKLDPHRLQEVWFAGAHSDVGGGYPDSRLSGVSLNWMIRRLRGVNEQLLPLGTAVPEDVYGTSHDPEAGGMSPVYHGINRDLVAYVRGGASLVDHLTVHPSVFARRAYVPVREHENRQLHLLKPGTVCLVLPPPDPNRMDFRGRLHQKEESKDPPAPCPPQTVTTVHVQEAVEK